MITLLFWSGVAAVVYGLSIWRLAEALAWFHGDTRAKLPRRPDRAFVHAVILAIAPILATIALLRDARNTVHRARVQHILARLPHQADPEQQHLLDEMQHPDFYRAAHNPAGTLKGADQ